MAHREIEHAVGIGHSTIWRMKHRCRHASIVTIEQIAGYLGYEVKLVKKKASV